MKHLAASVVVCLASLAAADVHALDAKAGSVRINFYAEPATMDPQRVSDTWAMTLVAHVLEGLTRLDPQNRPVPAAAASWSQTSPTQYLFKLRDDAKWHDGEPVTAAQFVLGWRRAVDPKVASPYAFFAYPVKNAQAINEGKLPMDKLGVTAVDARTLAVELERPTPYFPSLLAVGTFFPAREDYVAKFGQSYAADADKLAYNGAWRIAGWQHSASMKLTRNESYWNKEHIAIREIDMPYMLTDRTAELRMFETGQFDFVRQLSRDSLKLATDKRYAVKRTNTGSVTFLSLNHRVKTLANKNLRKALQLAMNRGEYAREINGIPGTRPAFGFLPDYLPGAARTYGEEFPTAFKDGDLSAAKTHLAAALKELGLERLPAIKLLTTDRDTSRRDAEYFQSYFRRALGVELTLESRSYKAFIEAAATSDFEMSYSSWSPDYLDAMSFADLYTSWNSYNHSGWSSSQLDSLVKQAQETADPTERMRLLHGVDAVLIEEAPILPVYQEYAAYLQDPRLNGVLRRVVSPDPDFYYARIADAVGRK